MGGLSAGDLSSDNYAHCQEVARRSREAGYEAIRYPSATGTGQNLAVFYDRLPAEAVVVRSAEPLDLAKQAPAAASASGRAAGGHETEAPPAAAPRRSPAQEEGDFRESVNASNATRWTSWPPV